MPKRRTAKPYNDGKHRLEVPVTFAVTLDQALFVIMSEVMLETPFQDLDHFQSKDWTDKEIRNALHEGLRGYGIVAMDRDDDNLPNGWRERSEVQNFRGRLSRLFGFPAGE